MSGPGIPKTPSVMGAFSFAFSMPPRAAFGHSAIECFPNGGLNMKWQHLDKMNFQKFEDFWLSKSDKLIEDAPRDW